MGSKQFVVELGKSVLPNRIIFSVSPNAIHSYSRFKTWYVCGRKYSAPIDPLELHQVTPTDVTYQMIQDGMQYFSHSNAISEVVDGQWDNEVVPTEETVFMEGFRERFSENRPWNETKLYQYHKAKLQRGESLWGCTSLEEFDERLKTLDNLFKDISESGYKSQKDLLESSGTPEATRDIHRYWPPNLNEVILNVGRNGELILHDGRHRYYMARLAGIDEIPVRIKVRHAQWQEKREAVVAGELNPNEFTHFDLTGLPRSEQYD